MRERAKELGGSCVIGRRAEGGDAGGGAVAAGVKIKLRQILYIGVCPVHEKRGQYPL